MSLTRRQQIQLLSLIFIVGCYGQQLDTYPVTWSQVSQDASAPVFFLNETCLCDMTSNVCDANCCCDQDCAEFKENNLFRVCAQSSLQLPQLDYCVVSDSVAQVNLPNTNALIAVKKKEPYQDFMKELLCIVEDNNPAFGNYFLDPSRSEQEDLQQAYAQSTVFATQYEDESTEQNTYKVGDFLRVAYVGSGPQQFGVGYFSLPDATFSAECSYDTFVAFMENVPSTSQRRRTSCEVTAQALSSEADEKLSGDTYINYLKFATYPRSNSEYVNVTIRSPESLASIPAFSCDATQCSNVVSQVDYTIVILATGGINEVYADVVTAKVNIGAGGILTVVQEFSVTFTTDASQVALPYSGNPGYLYNYPILAGVLVEDNSDPNAPKKAIQRFVDGLPILSHDSSGECKYFATRAVMFGISSIDTCSVSFSRSELKDFCESQIGQATESIELLQGLHLSGKRVYLGGWANANPNNYQEWIEMPLSSNSRPAMSWNEATSSCRSVSNIMHYRILTRNVGVASNPQQQIDYADVDFEQQDWKFVLADPSQQQDFLLQHVVTFTSRAQEVEELVPKAPPLLVSLPEDIFYPFVTTSSSTWAQSSITTTTILVVCVSSVVLILAI